MARPTLAEYLTGLLASAESWVTIPPGRAFVSHGRPVFACDSLAVWAERFDSLGLPGQKSSCHVQTYAVLHVSRAVCVPTMDEDGGELPADVYTESALDLADEGDALWFGLLASIADGDLFGVIPISCTSIDLTPGMTGLDPSGGMAGWDLAFRVTF